MPAVVIFIFFVIEFIVSGWFISAFSGGSFFLEIIVTGFIGVVTISSMGHHMNEAFDMVRKGELHPQELLSSAVGRVFGGVLLLIPGVFTDLIGILLILKSKKKSSSNSEKSHFKQHHTYENVYKKEDDDIIDVEVVEEGKNEKISNSNTRK